MQQISYNSVEDITDDIRKQIGLSNRSDFMPEDIQTLNKGCVRFKSGYIPGESEIREAMDRAMIMQLNLLPVARKMVLEELEMKQNG